MAPPRSGPVDRLEARAPLALAIDVGTSSTRVVAFDAQARPIAGTTTRAAHAVATDAAGAATLDPDALFDGVARCLDGTLRKLGRQRSEIAVVGLSVFWHGLLGIDARGKPTTRLFTWADLRARDAARALADELDPEAFHARTGGYLHSTYPAVKLRWLRDAQPKAVKRTVRWVSLAEYLALRLHGAAQVAHGMASATGLYDQGRRDWDPVTLAAIGVDATMLSPVSDAPLTDLRPAYGNRWPALAAIPWIPGIGDGALANIGSGCTTRDRAAISLGTSGAVRACFQADRADAPAGLWEYRLDERHVVVGGAVNNGWSAMEWSARTFGAAAKVGADHGLTVLPLLAGERTPWWDDAATGTITGLRLSTTPAQIAGALTESVLLRLAAATETLLDARPEIEDLVASGGVFAGRPELAQTIADAIGRPVSLASDAEASARGATIVALARIGALPSIETTPQVGRTYRPRPSLRARYRELLDRQFRLHAGLREAQL
ncbi:MAG: gluconokinase [Candidatus Limnocylindrales bacterium]